MPPVDPAPMPNENDSLRHYIDAELREIRRACDVATAAASVDGVPLRKYVEAVLDEQQRALDMANNEREKAALVLREQAQRALDKADEEREKSATVLRKEHHRANETATAEREKAALALRESLTDRIDQGDRALTEHINQQIRQIREALASAEKLELERVKASEKLAMAVQDKLTLTQDAAAQAIAKAEGATERRFEAVNEFRAQLQDQAGRFLLREVADAQLTEMRKQIQSNTDRLNRFQGAGEGEDRTEAERRSSIGMWVGVAGVTIAFLAALVSLLVAFAPS